MKLTQRQLDKIAGLINEEAEVRKNLHESMYESRKKSLLEQYLMFEGEGNLENLPKGFVDSISDDIANYSREVFSTVHSMIYESLATYMKSREFSELDAGEWMDEIEPFIEYEEQQNVAIDISERILAYAELIATNAATVANPASPSKKDSPVEDLEPRYSEFE